MLVSMIVPIYNTGRELLSRCVDSILGQTYKNLEVILVDDGSTDESGLVCDEYARADTRVVVIHKENGGEATARNAGLKRATGTFVGFSDSDDEWRPDGIQLLLDAICTKEHYDLVVGAYLMKIRDKTRIFVAEYEEYTVRQAELDSLLQTTLTGMTGIKFMLRTLNAKLFRMSIMQEIIQENGLFPYEETRISGDAMLMLDYLAKARSIRNIFMPIYIYYRDEDTRVQGSFGIHPDIFVWFASFYEKQLKLIGGTDEIDEKLLHTIYHNMSNEMIGLLIQAAAYEEAFPYPLEDAVNQVITAYPMKEAIRHYEPAKGKNPSIEISEPMAKGDIKALMEALRLRGQKYIQKHGKKSLVRLLYYKNM